jgi:hypothetical protein
MKLLIRANKNYHGCHWPHAREGDKVWGDEWLLARLERDAGKGAFSVVKIEAPDVSVDLEARGNGPGDPEGAESQAPKRKPGRPKGSKNKVKDGSQA